VTHTCPSDLSYADGQIVAKCTDTTAGAECSVTCDSGAHTDRFKCVDGTSSATWTVPSTISDACGKIVEAYKRKLAAGSATAPVVAVSVLVAGVVIVMA